MTSFQPRFVHVGKDADRNGELLHRVHTVRCLTASGLFVAVADMFNLKGCASRVARRPARDSDEPLCSVASLPPPPLPATEACEHEVASVAVAKMEIQPSACIGT
jgi:hypothetical protein